MQYGNELVDNPEIYDAFGRPVWPQTVEPGGTSGTNGLTSINGLFLRYKGQTGCVTDTQYDLVYCHHRYYDPIWARWITRDPIGLDGGVNGYTYYNGDPLLGSDPDGLQEGEKLGQFFLYVLLDVKDDVVKWGVSATTTKQPRYSRSWLKKNGYTWVPLFYSNSREDVLYQERMMVRTYPGTKNNEFWAGRGLATLKDIAEAFDPTPFKAAYDLGGLFGKMVVDPIVKKAQRSRERDLYWWLDEEPPPRH